MTNLQERLQAVLGDSYRIEQEIGGGGMSRLFLAVEASLERKVVVKLLPPDTASDVSAARFQRETLVTANLQHPHILPVLSSGARDGLFFYIMPFVEGESLQHRLKREGRLPLKDSILILREVSDALAYAHRQGVVHRDIKPSNILLEEGHAVLCDFGIARALAAARGETGAGERLTGTGMSVGTVGYMAPEQLAGERNVDARADIYALAVVGYEMLSGEPPFTGPTAQSILAAHLTQPPKTLSSVRPDVPAPLSDAIAKALAKMPDERFESASQFRAALDFPETSTYPVLSLRRTRVRLGLAVLALIVASGAAAAVWRSRSQVAVNPNLLAVAPFEVRNADTTWREGLVDILSRKLDNAGPITTVSATVSIQRWAGRADRESARALGRRTDAGLVVFGSLIGDGADSVTISAAILNVIDNRLLGNAEIEVHGPRDQINRLADELTRSLLREIGKTRPIGASRQTSLGSQSLPALKAFLTGEQWYRRTAWDSAIAYYGRALAEDSTFSLAHRHAGLAISWLHSFADSTSRAYLLRAGQWNRGLSTRDSLLVVADSIRSSLSAFESDTAHLATTRRLFATLEHMVREYPHDPEIWLALGEAHFHVGFGVDKALTEPAMLAAFDSAIKIDSAFAPAYLHAVELGFVLGGTDAGRSYAQKYIALEPIDADAEGIRVLEATFGPDSAGKDARRLVDTASAFALYTAWRTVRRWTDSAESGVHFARLDITGRRSSGEWYTDPAFRRLLLALQLAYRGKLSEAYDLIGTNVSAREARLFSELAFLGGVPPDTARKVFARLLRDEVIYPAGALPWWAARGDTMSIRLLAFRAESTLSVARTGVQRRDARYRVAAAKAYLALARYDTADAMAQFSSLSDTLCLVCYIDRLVKARIFVTRGRDLDAHKLLSERLQILLSPTELEFALERARVAERLQDHISAIADYARVAEGWARADTSLQPRVTEARKALQRLGGDRLATTKLVSR